jgi:predicted aspartyl protease
VECLEDRLVLSTSLTVQLNAFLDRFGTQIPIVQTYGGGPATIGILDTGASPIAFSAYDVARYAASGHAIPVLVAGGATAQGIGGSITGDVSQAGTIQADGLHALHFHFNGLGFPTISFDFSDAATVNGVQAFLGTFTGSPNLPTVTGTPIFDSGLAAEVNLHGFQLGFGLSLPDVHFVAANTQLTQTKGTTAPVTIPLGSFGTDNSANPGNSVTTASNFVQNNVSLASAGHTLSGQNFLLDTGSQITVISTAEAQALGLDLTHPTTTLTVQGVGGAVTVPGFTLDTLSVPTSDGGTLTFTHVPVYVLDAGQGLDGILGMNLLNRASTLLITPGTHPSVSLTFSTSAASAGGTGLGRVFEMTAGANFVAGGQTLSQLLGGASGSFQLPTLNQVTTTDPTLLLLASAKTAPLAFSTPATRGTSVVIVPPPPVNFTLPAPAALGSLAGAPGGTASDADMDSAAVETGRKERAEPGPSPATPATPATPGTPAPPVTPETPAVLAADAIFADEGEAADLGGGALAWLPFGENGDPQRMLAVLALVVGAYRVADSAARKQAMRPALGE